MTHILYIVFFFSGLAGLVYESVWTRYLGLFVGHSAYAQVIVLTVFLGGLSAGSLIAGQWSERLRWPLLWYAGVELTVGVMGFVFHDVFVFVQGIAHTQLFPLLGEGPVLMVAKWGLAGGLILPPSVLLGTTFPLMSATLLRLKPEGPGRTLSLLYFANSIGAALGALVAGFVLLGSVGLSGSVFVAGALNVGVAFTAWVLSVRLPVETSQPTRYDPPPTQAERSRDRLWKLLLAISFGTAVASFMYEIAWIRMLSLVLGAATHAFELMLSAFILGLAIGALLIRRRADTFENPLRALGVIQWCMGLAAMATLPLYLDSFSWTQWLLQGLDATEAGYTLFNLGRYGIALAVMLPSTICAGMTLPLITRVLVTGPRGERAIGWVYGVNTAGSIVGVIVASLVLLPLIGLKALLVAGAALDMALGVVLFVHARDTSESGRVGRGERVERGGRVGRVRVPLAMGAAAVLTGMIVWTTPFSRSLLNSGVFRSGRTDAFTEVLFWKDGRTASVGVGSASGFRSISTNAKIDGTLSEDWAAGQPAERPTTMVLDESTQTLLGLVTLAHVPEARTVAVIGQGTGMTSHILLGSTALEELVTLEIEPAMIEGSRLFIPANRRVFEDPRSTFVIDDARSYFASSQRRFDMIVSEPSNPWVSGVSSLFTVEFYAQVSQRLAPEGVFGQWLHLYEMNDDLVLSVLAALHENFPSYELFSVGPDDILIVASNGPATPTPDWSVLELPAVAADLRRFHRLGPAYLERTRFLTRRALAPLLDRWSTPNSDYDPILELGAELARYLDRGATGFQGAAEASFDPSDAFLPDLIDLEVPGPPPVPEIRALAALNLAATLKAHRQGEPAEDQEDRVLTSALYDEAQLTAVLQSSEPPPDWASWLAAFRPVAARRHGGTRGWVDSDLYDRAEAFALTHGAPAAVLTGLAFDRALRIRDWEAVAAATLAALPPVDTPSPSEILISPALLRDAGVMALILTGQVREGRRVFNTLRSAVPRPAGDLRSRLLAAYLRRAEEGGAL